MKVILVLYVSSGLLLAALAVPMIRRWIKPNLFYGFRVRQTLENPTVWYAANAYAGKRLLLVGISMALAALVLYFIPGLSLDGYALACLGVTATALIITLVQSFLYLKTFEK